MTQSPQVEYFNRIMAGMGYTATTVRERTPEEICCGDPTNLDGNAHPWNEIGEDNRGIHYRCPVCGATDVD
ncbi:MAG: hypothetical protein ABR585_07620 [Gemmatimonadaceae bacterium]